MQESKSKKKTHITERLKTYEETLGTSLEHEHQTEADTRTDAMNGQIVKGKQRLKYRDTLMGMRSM